MGRRSKQKPGAGNKTGAAASGSSINKLKKTKNLFKVADVKQKKKPKEVQGKLKQVNKDFLQIPLKSYFIKLILHLF